MVKLLGDAVDTVRRAESKERWDLRKTRYSWLKNPQNLTAAPRRKLDGRAHANLKLVRAYQIRLTFQELYEHAPEDAETLLKRWYFCATHSRLAPVIEAANTAKRHWTGVLRWLQTRIANGLLEGINSLVQAAKAKVRGSRSNCNLQAIIYLLAGKLDLGLPT